MTEKKRVLILGGAGFIGSNLVRAFVEKGWEVTALDGLLESTGGNLENIENIRDKVTFLRTRVEDCRELGLLIEGSDLIIDSMAWTTHRTALSFPEYDLDLNCRSHLNFIHVLKNYPDSRVIYIGSKVQYGNPVVKYITEETQMLPEDIQGIHKLAAETYYKIYSKMYGFNAVSLRIPGCFGINQPYKEKDLGLVGNFIRDAIEEKDLVVFGSGRKRSLLYVEDLEKVITLFGDIEFYDFSAFNIGGTHIEIDEIARMIMKLSGSSREVVVKELDKDFIDIGNIPVDDRKIEGIIGQYKSRDIEGALFRTIEYYKGKLK